MNDIFDKMKIDDMVRDVIKRLAIGPHNSKDLSVEEARAVTNAILDQEVDPVQAGVFLIALRMKGETLDEFQGVLLALREHAVRAEVDVKQMIDIAEPFDGYSRHFTISPFMPAVFAACGLPAVMNGVESVGPKYGITALQVLRHCDIDVMLSPEEAASRVEDESVSWAFVDQNSSNPDLHRLRSLRHSVVKRTALTTLERVVHPLEAKGRNLLLLGYVHRAYPPIYAAMATVAGFDVSILVKGIEGGVIPALNKPIRYHMTDDTGALTKMQFSAQALGVSSDVAAEPSDESHDRKTELAKFAARGIAALHGEIGLARDGLRVAVGLPLFRLGMADTMSEAADMVSDCLDNGEAWRRFQNAKS